MAKAVTRLFRHPQSVEKATSELKAKGYKEGEIALLLRKEDAAKLTAIAKPAATTEATLPGGSTIIATGPVAKALTEAGATTSSDLMTILTKTLDISEEEYSYYEFGISIGGVLVSVYTDESQAEQVRQVLRDAEVVSQKAEIWANSPAFVTAGRMTATDPVDAPMSGDFRKY